MNAPSTHSPQLLIGITGHRDPADATQPELRRAVINLLQQLHAHFPDSQMILLSALAEGADRLVAELALELPWLSLWSILPLPVDDYEEDFETAQSRGEFQRLLRASQRCVISEPQDSEFVLDTDSALREQAYQAAGLAIAAQSDLMLALWDGEQIGKTGGTGDIVQQCAQGIKRRPPGEKAAQPLTRTLRQAMEADDTGLG